MGSQQRNVNLATKLPIKSRGSYFMNNNVSNNTEFNPYEKYMVGIKKKNKKSKKGKKK